MTTVSDVFHYLAPFVEVREEVLPSHIKGRFAYNATDWGHIGVESLDSSDVESLVVAIHEISHYKRYCAKVPYYRVPHHEPVERAVEEILTDRLALSLVDTLTYLDEETRDGLTSLLRSHQSREIRDLAVCYLKDEAPKEFVCYEIDCLVDDQETAEYLVNRILSHME